MHTTANNYSWIVTNAHGMLYLLQKQRLSNNLTVRELSEEGKWFGLIKGIMKPFMGGKKQLKNCSSELFFVDSP